MTKCGGVCYNGDMKEIVAITVSHIALLYMIDDPMSETLIYISFSAFMLAIFLPDKSKDD